MQYVKICYKCTNAQLSLTPVQSPNILNRQWRSWISISYFFLANLEMQNYSGHQCVFHFWMECPKTTEWPRILTFNPSKWETQISSSKKGKIWKRLSKISSVSNDCWRCSSWTDRSLWNLNERQYLPANLELGTWLPRRKEHKASHTYPWPSCPQTEFYLVLSHVKPFQKCLMPNALHKKLTCLNWATPYQQSS